MNYKLIAFFLSICLFVSLSAGQTYPRIDLTPAAPTVSDSVSLQIVKGMAGNSCMAPTYEKVSFTITTSPILIYPPAHTITISYAEVPVPPNKICPMVYAPIEYGPLFKFGRLELGSYTVMEGNTVVTRFSVTQTAAASLVQGTVMEACPPCPVGALCERCLPPPVAGAKVYLEQYIDCPMCAYTVNGIYPGGWYTIIDSTVTDAGGHYAFGKVASGNYTLGFSAKGYQPLNVYVSVLKDTVVDVALTPISSYCSVSGKVIVACPAGPIVIPCPFTPIAGCTITVSRLIAIPLYKAAGIGMPYPYSDTYSAVTDNQGNYKIDSIPLLGNDNVYITAMKSGYGTEYKDTALVANGNISLSFALQKSTPVSIPNHSKTVDNSSVRFSSRTGVLTIALDKPQSIKISAFTLSGVKIPQVSFNEKLGAGSHQITIGKINHNTVVLRIERDGVVESRKVSLMHGSF